MKYQHISEVKVQIIYNVLMYIDTQERVYKLAALTDLNTYSAHFNVNKKKLPKK